MPMWNVVIKAVVCCRLDRGLFRFVTGYQIKSLGDSDEMQCCAKEMSACLLCAVVLLVNKHLIQRSFSLSAVDALLVTLCSTALRQLPHKNDLKWVPTSFTHNSTDVSTHLLDSPPTTLWNILSAERISIVNHMLRSVKECMGSNNVLQPTNLEAVTHLLSYIQYLISLRMASYSPLFFPLLTYWTCIDILRHLFEFEFWIYLFIQWKHKIIISYCHWKGLCYRQMPNEAEPWKTKCVWKGLNLREGWCLETWTGKKRLWTVILLRMYSFSKFPKKIFESFWVIFSSCFGISWFSIRKF